MLTTTLLFSVFKDDFEEERETNLSAMMAAMQLWGNGDVVRLTHIYTCIVAK